MKLVGVVCRVVEDNGTNHLENIEPAAFLDMLSEAAQEPEAADIAALEAELAMARAHATPANPVNAIVEGSSFNADGDAYHDPQQKVGEIRVVPRSAVEPIVGAKTRGEVYEKIDELLALVGARLAREGEY